MKYSITFHFDVDFNIEKEEEIHLLNNVANQVKIEVNNMKSRRLRTDIDCSLVNEEIGINHIKIALDKNKLNKVN